MGHFQVGAIMNKAALFRIRSLQQIYFHLYWKDTYIHRNIIANSLSLKISSINEVIYNNTFPRNQYDNIVLAKSNNIDFNINPKDIEIEENVVIIFNIK